MLICNKNLFLVKDFDNWLENIQINWTKQQIAVVRQAYNLSGEHNLSIVNLLTELGMDHAAVAAALLHIAACNATTNIEYIVVNFGNEIASLVNGINKIDTLRDLHQNHKSMHQLENLRKMFLAMAQDVRVLIIKLAMHLQVLRNIDQLAEDNKQRIARETLDIFTPLANRLGIGKLKWEMEDLALRCLDLNVYKQIAAAIDERRSSRELYISRVIDKLRSYLYQAGINADVSGRVKHIYSIWKKMQRKQVSFEQIFDVCAVRVMVNTINDCYSVLGVVHANWAYIDGEFDDYIAHPKTNGYQSLHTAVISLEGRALEVQIRTQQMHHEAELGVAAHWRYKEYLSNNYNHNVTWLRKILEYPVNSGECSDLIERCKAAIFQDRVYSLTPKGTIIELPKGATPLDFAYHIHTEIGHHCRGAKVDGRIVPLNYQLKNGEQVEVLTTKNGGPSRDWLSTHLGYIKTNRAKYKIKQWFLKQEQDRSINIGRAALERELQKLGTKYLKLEKKLATILKFNNNEELYMAIGNGTLSINQVIGRIQEFYNQCQHQSVIGTNNISSNRKHKNNNNEPRQENVIINGVGQLLIQIAHCCQPVPFESIIGYITQGRGVTVHRQNCSNLIHLVNKNERIIEVNWGNNELINNTYPVDIVITAYDRPGLLRDITSILANEQINVRGTNTLTDNITLLAHMRLTLEITDIIQLNRILDKISRLHSIILAYRRI